LFHAIPARHRARRQKVSIGLLTLITAISFDGATVSSRWDQAAAATPPATGPPAGVPQAAVIGPAALPPLLVSEPALVTTTSTTVDPPRVTTTTIAPSRAPAAPPVPPPPPPPPPPAKSRDPRDIALRTLARFGWDGGQFGCLDALWRKESNWSPTAANRTSGAYGIAQALPGSKMASIAPDWRTNPETQVVWGLSYIQGRYGSPCAAWAHSRKTNWY
jgi:hypothetical protein